MLRRLGVRSRRAAKQDRRLTGRASECAETINPGKTNRSRC